MKHELMHYQAREIERTLAAKRLAVRVTGGHAGHRLICYELAKPAAVDLAAIERQTDELALALGASSCRVGRRNGTITCEIPRHDPLTVDLQWVLGRLPDRQPTAAVVGVDGEDCPLLLQLASPNVGHALIAGTTGSGKTVLARGMIASLAMTHSPPDLGLILIDPKRRGYRPFAGLPHLAHPVIHEPCDAIGMLAWATKEMERRDQAGTHTPTLAVFVDELADLALVAGDELEVLLTRLVQRGREAGIHTIACTQKPTARVIGSLVKANFPARVVGKVTDTNEAYVAAGIGSTGAERLLGKGDMLAVVGGQVTRFQAAHVAEGELAEIVTRLRGGRPLNSTSDSQTRPRGNIVDFVERYRAATEGATSSATGGATDSEAIRRDHEAGMSQRELEEKYFGFTGGAAYRKVKEALQRRERQVTTCYEVVTKKRNKSNHLLRLNCRG